jgi:hypothetical protein
MVSDGGGIVELYLGKTLNPPIVLGQREYVGGRGLEEMAGADTPPLARLGLARATRWCGALLAPLRIVLWLRGSSGKIGFLQYFPIFF